MKRTINSLQDAFAYQLQGLFYAETKVRDEFNACSHQITSSELKAAIKEYIDNADSRLLKLERVFNYLMEETATRKNEVIIKLIEETHHILKYTMSSHLKDILLVGCIQNINAYKISSYKSAYLFAVELELDTATDLIQQILEWELEAAKAFNAQSVLNFNVLNNSVGSK
jgi:ferritin-like metal-binding protein YciE